MSSENGLVCFTNCLLPLEDGSLVEQDLWLDERRGVILDAQVGVCGCFREQYVLRDHLTEDLFHASREASSHCRPRWQYPQVCHESICSCVLTYPCGSYSPGYMDIQINGAYGFDFSVFDGNHDAYRYGVKTVAEKIVETGVTS